MRKIVYFLIYLIISFLIFNTLQTNRVYIKAAVNNDCTVELNYSNFKNESQTIYKRVFKYSDEETQKIKFRLKDNIKSMNLIADEKALDIKSISVISGFIPVKVKTFDITYSVFIKILALRIIVSLFFGLLISFIGYKFIEWVYKRKERFMIYLFIFVFCMPVMTMFLPLDKINVFNIVGERTVYGIPKLTIKSYIDKSFQQQFEGWFNQEIVWNSLYIKLFNTIYYVLFDKSYSSNSNIIIGKGKQLYEKAYISTLFFPDRYTDTIDIPSVVEVKQTIDSQIRDLNKIQKYLESKGRTFLFVITPSKADFEQENIPDRFNVQAVTYQNFLHNTLIGALNRNSINYVDTPTYLKQNSNGCPVYAVGGIHWNDWGKYLATKNIVEKLNDITNYNFAPIEVEKSYLNRYPQNEDKDLVSLLNILNLPKSYTVENLIYKTAKNKHSDLVVNVVGGSFSSGFCDGLTLSHTVKDIEYYFYITKKIISYKNYLKSNLVIDNTKNNISNNIRTAIKGDIVILELNDSLIGTKKGHFQIFINEVKKVMAEENK